MVFSGDAKFSGVTLYSEIENDKVSCSMHYSKTSLGYKVEIYTQVKSKLISKTFFSEGILQYYVKFIHIYLQNT